MASPNQHGKHMSSLCAHCKQLYVVVGELVPTYFSQTPRGKKPRSAWFKIASVGQTGSVPYLDSPVLCYPARFP
jgi:hypothetical protein